MDKQDWMALSRLKPRKNRNVLVKVWGYYFAARYHSPHQWYLPLSDSYIKAEGADEWTALR